MTKRKPQVLMVTGGREFDDFDMAEYALTYLEPEYIFTGGCPTGADIQVAIWCSYYDIPCAVIPAWQNWAEPKRNDFMLDMALEFAKRHAVGGEVPDVQLLVLPGGEGTANCEDAARQKGISVLYAEDIYKQLSAEEE